MSKRETYEEKTEHLLTPIVEKYGVEIYDVEYVKEGKDYYLRVYIDKAAGVNILDCENVSRALAMRYSTLRASWCWITETSTPCCRSFTRSGG